MTNIGTNHVESDYLKAFVIGAAVISSSVGNIQSNYIDNNENERSAYIAPQRSSGGLSFLKLHTGVSTAHSVEQPDTTQPTENLTSSILADAFNIIRGFHDIVDGWDGEGSRAPKVEIISDALTLLQNWPESIGAPEPVLEFDGNIALELYTDDGFTSGGVELVGNNEAIYTVVAGQELIKSGVLNTKLQKQIIKTMEDFILLSA